MHKWKCQKSELILDTKYFKVRRDTVKLPNQEIVEWIYWDSKDSAMVLGMTFDKKLVMIQQYRYLADREVLEFPSGGLHNNENIEECARREFEEESGYRCGQLIKLGSFYETYGQLNRKIHFFFAPQVQKTKQNLDQGEKGFEDIKVELVEFKDAVRMASDNTIVAMGSALAILLLKEKIENKEIKI
ncbi:MAG: NUDIX hydrolase [Patescibacteria group bacterium]|nr:NUDIX hydrolase [Patescibacteria group bacterium]